jgi:hypothetical protein
MRASPDGEAIANVGFPDGLAHQAEDFQDWVACPISVPSILTFNF